MDYVPVITLWQPYASLIFAEGIDGGRVKRHETRGYPYPDKYDRQEIGIHAAKAFTPCKLISDDLHELCMEVFGCHYEQRLPRGALLGTVRLNGWLTTDNAVPDEDDRLAGDWSPGRYAWNLRDVKPMPGGVMPCSGKQGWWRLPTDLVFSAMNPKPAKVLP